MKLVKFIALCLCIFVTTTGCDSTTDRQNKYLDKAKLSFSNNDYEIARISYSNVLAINPENIEAKYGLAQTLEKLKDWRGAFANYKAVIDADPDHIASRLKLGQLYLLANEAALALNEAEYILKNDAMNAVAVAIKAGVLFQQGQLNEAIKLAEEAYILEPDDIDVLVMLVSLHRADQNDQQAIELIEKDVGKNPNRPSLRVLLAEININRGEFEKAEKQYEVLIKIYPEQVVYKKALVGLYEKQSKIDKAEKVLLNILDDDVENVDAVLAYAQFLIRNKDVVQALEHLDMYINTLPGKYELQFAKAGLLQTSGRVDEAVKIYKTIVKEDDIAGLKSKSRLAVIAFKNDNSEEGNRLLEEVLSENPEDFDALFIKASVALDGGKIEAAIIDLRQILDAKPDSVQVITLLGKAYVKNKQFDLAAQTYSRALNYYPIDKLRIELAMVYEEMSLFDKANKQLTIVDKNNSENLDIKLRIIQNNIKLKNNDQAIDFLDKLAIKVKENPIIDYYYGLAYQDKGDHSRAIYYFDKSLQQSPGSTEPMTGKTRSLINLNQLDKAISWLEDITKDQDDNVVAHNVIGEIYLSQKLFDKAIASFDKAIVNKPQWWIPYRNKARAYELDGDKNAYIRTLVQGIDKVDAPGILQLQLAQEYQQDKSYEQAISIYENILKHTESSELAANNLASLLINHRQDNESLKRALKLTKIFEKSENPFFKDTVGWTYYVNGNYQQALEALLYANSKLPDIDIVKYHVGMAYYNLNDIDSALSYLESSIFSGKHYQGRGQAEEIIKEIKQNS